MQVSWNYRTDKTFLQIKQGLCLSVVFLIVFGLFGCAQSKLNTVVSNNSILPIADSSDLPTVIKSLLKQSDEQYLNQNLTGALATLERAVRINPRHGEVWSRMAKIYFQQGNLEQAKQHAKRSNSVLKKHSPLKDFNDRIIAPPSAEALN